jgi:hypothetical protein
MCRAQWEHEASCMASSPISPEQQRNVGLVGEPPDFSLVLGGPLYQLFRKAHLEGDHLELLYRRMLVIPLFAWLPLLLLALFGSPGQSSTRVSFFRDVEVHVRFLVALPVLIAAEVIAHSRLRPAVRRFVERRIVPLPEMSRFYTAVDGAVKLRNSIPLELSLVFIVYTVGLWLWNGRVGIDVATWYASPGGRWHLTPAGIWYVFVSIPMVQFILLRWYMRFFIWYRFLWNIARIKLHLIPTHPDRAGGLAFVGSSAYAFGPILFAQGAMLAGVVASRVLYRGENLLSFKLQAIGFVAFFVFAILAPLVMFTPQLARAKRKGLADYGLLAQRYVEGFEQKWVVAPSGEELLGTGDIQSLADLGNSYIVVKEMRVIPFGLQDISRLAIATAAPMVPLLLTIWSPEELVTRIIKVVF